jgi:NADPH:quinone reductase-like Zn-dependent oxidoreductase
MRTERRWAARLPRLGVSAAGCFLRIRFLHARPTNYDRLKMSESIAAPLAGRVVLVTGASSGIGRAIAVGAAQAGADVALTYKSNVAGARDTESQVRALGRHVATFQLDIADESAIARIGPAVRDGFGRLDVWINNAGADILTGPGASLSDLQKMTCCSQSIFAARLSGPGVRPRSWPLSPMAA